MIPSPQKDAAPTRGRGLGVRSFDRLDGSTSYNREDHANRFGVPLRAHEEIIVVASMFRPEILNGFADVLRADMFIRDMPRALALEAAELIRTSGTCSALLVCEKVNQGCSTQTSSLFARMARKQILELLPQPMRNSSFRGETSTQRNTRTINRRWVKSGNRNS